MKRKNFLTGMMFTWSLVIGIIISGIIRVEYLTPEYEQTYWTASIVYAIGWFFSLMVYILEGEEK